MQHHARLDLIRTYGPAIQSLANRFSMWWWAEYEALFSQRVTAFFRVNDRTQLITTDLAIADSDSVDTSTTDGREPRPLVLSNNDVDQYRVRNPSRRKQIRFVVRLSERHFLRRNFIVPNEALPSVAQLVEKDILRRTPLKLGEFYSDHRIERGVVPGTSIIKSYAVKKTSLDTIIRTINEEEILAIQNDSPSNSQSFIQIRLPQSRHKRQLSKLIFYIMLSGFCALFMLCLFRYYDINTTIRDMDEEIVQLRPKVQRVQSLIDAAKRRHQLLSNFIVAMDGRPNVVMSLNLMTAAVPNDTWLSELKITGDKLQLSGHSQDAARLVRLFNQSGDFSQAALVAPITKDPINLDEVFSVETIRKKRSQN